MRRGSFGGFFRTAQFYTRSFQYPAVRNFKPSANSMATITRRKPISLCGGPFADPADIIIGASRCTWSLFDLFRVGEIIGMRMTANCDASVSIKRRLHNVTSVVSPVWKSIKRVDHKIPHIYVFCNFDSFWHTFA